METWPLLFFARFTLPIKEGVIKYVNRKQKRAKRHVR